MMLHTKYQGSRLSGFSQEVFLKFSYRKSIFSLCDLDIYATDQNHLNNFDRGLPKDYVCKFILKLNQGIRWSCHLSQLLTDDRRMEDGRSRITKAHLVIM